MARIVYRRRYRHRVHRAAHTLVVAAAAICAALAVAAGYLLGTRAYDLVLAPWNSEWVVVAHVVDGDTFRTADGRVVRVLGVDTPETVNPSMDGAQPFAQAASDRAKSLLADRRIALETDQTDRDHYGRLLRHVWIGGQLLSEVLISEGLGRVSLIPPDIGHEARLRAAERAAQVDRLGVWSEDMGATLSVFATPPGW